MSEYPWGPCHLWGFLRTLQHKHGQVPETPLWAARRRGNTRGTLLLQVGREVQACDCPLPCGPQVAAQHLPTSVIECTNLDPTRRPGFSSFSASHYRPLPHVLHCFPFASSFTHTRSIEPTSRDPKSHKLPAFYFYLFLWKSTNPTTQNTTTTVVWLILWQTRLGSIRLGSARLGSYYNRHNQADRSIGIGIDWQQHQRVRLGISAQRKGAPPQTNI